MLFWIILFIGLIASVCIAHGYKGNHRTTNGDRIFNGCALFCGAIAIAFAVCGIAATIFQDSKITEEISSEKLVSVQDQVRRSSSSSGAFVFVVGGFSSSSSEDLNYAWYSQDTETHAISAVGGIAEDFDTKIEIYYLKDGEYPYVARVTYNCSTPENNLISPMNLSIESGDCIDRAGDETWRLYVPRGSIVKDFNFDLK